VKAKIESFLSNQKLKKSEFILFSLFILFLPTQFGKHFWPGFALVSGIQVDYLSPTLYVTDILVALLFIFFLGEKRYKKISSFSFVLLSIFILFLLFTIFRSHNIFNGLYHLLKFVECAFVAFYVSTTITTQQQIKHLVSLFSFGILFEAFLAICQFIAQGSLGGLLYFLGERTFTSQTPGIANASLDGQLVLRPYATFSHPNVLAGFLLICMVFVLFQVISQKYLWQKALSLTSLLLGTAGLLLTMSRGAIVIWFLLLIIIFFIQLKQVSRQQRQSKVLFIIGVLFVFLVMLIFAKPVGIRLLHTNLSEESIVQRETLVSASGQLLQKSPFFGVGFGNFLPSLATIQKPLSVITYLQPVHNIFLLVLVETGAVGFGFLLGFVIKTYAHLFLVIRSKVYNPKIFIVYCILLTIMLVLGFIDHYWLTLQQGQLLFAVILGLCWTKIST